MALDGIYTRNCKQEWADAVPQPPALLSRFQEPSGNSGARSRRTATARSAKVKPRA